MLQNRLRVSHDCTDCPQVDIPLPCVGQPDYNVNKSRPWENGCTGGISCETIILKFLHMVEVLQVLGAKPLLKCKVSEQLDVSLCNFPPALMFLHHLFQTTQYTQTQFLQGLHIWMTHERQFKKNKTRMPRQISQQISIHLPKQPFIYAILFIQRLVFFV